jgi:hypothetical protein
VPLVGAINGANTVFTTPDDFEHDPSGASIAVYYNGMRLEGGTGCDYTVSESGGAGTGFDTVTLTFAPKSGDKLLADYIKA